LYNLYTMLFNKWTAKNDLINMMVISSIISLFFIFLGLIGLIWQPYVLYGFLMGLGAAWVSYFLTWLIGEKLFNIMDAPKVTVAFQYFIRLAMLTAIMLISLLWINPQTSEGNNVKLLLETINIFAMIIAYQLPLFSILFLSKYTKFINNKSRSKK